MTRAPAWTRAEALAFGVLAAVGTALRFWQLTGAPAAHDNPDEVAYAWAGLSLWQRGVPTSWSTFAQYPAHADLVTAGGRHWPLVHPWLDEPPLFALLVGGINWLGGVRGYVDDQVLLDRLAPVTLGCVSIVLLYLLARRRPPC